MVFSPEDDNWEGELNFSTGTFLKSPKPAFAGGPLYLQDHEADLALASHRLLDTQSIDDDDTESTFSSLHSDKTSLNGIDELSDIDSFMYSPQIVASSGPGTITHFGHHRPSHASNDWCDDLNIPETDFPKFSRRTQPPVTKLADEFLNDGNAVDVAAEEEPARRVRFNDTDQINTYAPWSHTSTLDLSHEARPSREASIPVFEPEADDETFDDLQFPEDMADLNPRLDRRKAGVLSPKRAVISSKFIEQDQDDDFCKDLSINSDDTFSIDRLVTETQANTNATNTEHLNHHSTGNGVHPTGTIRRSTFRLGRTALKPNNATPNHRPSPSNVSQIPRPTDLHTRNITMSGKLPERRESRRSFKAPTFASRQRHMETTSKPPQTRSNALLNQTTRTSMPRTRPTPNGVAPGASHAESQAKTPSVRRGPTGLTLFCKPHSKVPYGNGTELDDLDNIPTWRGSRQSTRVTETARTQESMKSMKDMQQQAKNRLRHIRSMPQLTLNEMKKRADNTLAITRQPVHSKVRAVKDTSDEARTSVDPKRPWRQNMSLRKPTLIRMSDQPSKQEYNNMVYDPTTYQWKGNENVVTKFDGVPAKTAVGKASPPTKVRPVLIKKTQKSANKYTQVMVGSMIFDDNQLCWKKVDNGDGTADVEDDVFTNIEDLPENGPTTRTQPWQKFAQTEQPEFELSKPVQHEMMQEEERHCELFKHFPLSTNERMVENWAGQKVPAFTEIPFMSY
ncbi:uncharacterized protein BYT42DRAFT_555451 [Radiomyces spectabilis]|uniref:uncharacterized protein n=1 Tax=Radiomyces spectabilis TaxID=64574 RepID=UPI002220E925|nr:uncharacterized protein BYT42DRAFT_555451 [Radiomyces spectabilis]KAI8391065.1 hypothetical protein BYT42DRAFT_555451 [Radiomyces spectabilis]